MATTSRGTSSDIQGIRERLNEIGDHFNPETITENFKLFTPLHETAPFSGVDVIRDLHYGDDERHRLDVFRPKASIETRRPVLLFVHGGGFVGGDKSMPGTPFWDNVGVWAVRNGLIGVNITYRFAPAHPWPAGAEDLAAALRWVRNNIGTYGGDAKLVYLMGQSAGGAHVAHFLAHARFASHDREALAGAILVSGLYDTNAQEKGPMFKAYFGEDPTRYAEQSALPGAAETSVPLMVVLAEHDPADFKRQCLELLNAYLQKRRTLPHLIWLANHGHLSTILSLNTEDDFLGERILDFVDSTSAKQSAASA